MNVVKICQKHHQPLLQLCPHCAQTSHLFTSTSLPAGYCSKCGGWLGAIPTAQDGRRLKTSKDRLRRYCLNLCNTISQRYATYHRMLVEQMKADIQQQVRHIAQELHTQGINPTSSAVSRHMTHSSFNRGKTAQDALKQVRLELGY